MTPDLVIFDCDGVLVDTEVITNQVISDNLAHHGLQIAPEDCHTLFSGGTMQGAMAEGRARGANLPDDWLDEIYGAIFAALSKGVRVMDGLWPLLDAVEVAGTQTCIASNGPMEKMRISLGQSGLFDRFEGRIFSRGLHGAPKPAPDMLLHACHVFDVEPVRAVMVDDSPAGLIAAKRAGVGAIGFDEGGQSSRLTPHADHIVSSMSELRNLLTL